MTIVGIGELRNALSNYLNRAAFGHERIIVTSRGKPKAAVISIEDLRLLQDLEDAQAAREAVEAYRGGEAVAWEDVKADLATGPDSRS